MVLFATISVVTSHFSQYQQLPSVNLPEISFSDLLTLDKNVALAAANHLITLGAIQIKDIPNFGFARRKALTNLASCLQSEGNLGVSQIMRAMDLNGYQQKP